MIHHRPLLHETTLTTAHAPSDQLAIDYAEFRFVTTVRGVKMRRRMIVEEHADRDAVKQ